MSGDLQLHLVETFEDAENFLRWLSEDRGREYLGCDTETQGLVLNRDRVRTVQFGDLSECWTIPFEHGGWGGLVQEVFDRYGGDYAFHNAKFDVGRLQAEGVDTPAWRQVHDTHIMSHLHNNEEPNKGLKILAKKYCGIDAAAGERAKDKFMKDNGYDWATVPIKAPEFWQYGALDTTITSALASRLGGVRTTYAEAYDLEMAAMRVLMIMEANGISVDSEYTNRTRDFLKEIYDKLCYFEEVPNKQPQPYLREFDIRPNFKEDIIQWFTSRGISVPVKTTKAGKISVDDEVLSKIDHPMARKIQLARHLHSWINNYLDKLVENEVNGKVHPHINPVGSDKKGKTGRMAITDPALSVLEKSALIRDCIVAQPGWGLLSIDYQNEELRIIASLCQSPGMIKAFESGLDMHKQTAAKMYGIEMEEVTSKQKTNAKRAMFTKAYGGKEATFAAYMGLSYEEGARYFHTLSSLYPELDEYIEFQKQTIKANKMDGYGHIFLSNGTRLNIPANISFKAVSYSSQGEGAIVLKKKLCQLEAAGFGPYLRLPVHDENVMEAPLDEFEEIRKEAMEIMTCYDYTVPLTVDGSEPLLKWGDDYAETRRPIEEHVAALYEEVE